MTRQSGFRFSQRSLNALEGVHPKLVAIAHRALELSPVDFVVTEGLRTKERQAKLVKAGASRTLNSQHILGRAIDVAPWIDGTVRWDWSPFHKIARAFKTAAAEQGVVIVWGGDWKTFKDGPHFELGRRE